MKSPRPPKFPVELDDPQRAALERIRIKLGARSAADAIRKLIEENDPERRQVHDWRCECETCVKARAAYTIPSGPEEHLTAQRIEPSYEPLAKPPKLYPAKPLSSMSGTPSPKGKRP